LKLKRGKLLALSGIVGCGKTTILRRIQEALFQDKEILASKSLSLEKSQISLATLIMALFYDLATEKEFKIPTQPERRERALRDLIKKRADLLNVKPREIKSFLSGHLAPGRTQELQTELLAAGIPL
jgi:type II secretory pathway predicted ATPase ExeA